MPTVSELQKVRIKKLKKIQDAGLLAYPTQVKRTHTIEEVIQGFVALARSKKEVIIVGRVRALREHGGSTFAHMEDGTGKVQAYFKKHRLGEKSYQFFLDIFDIGDFA